MIEKGDLLGASISQNLIRDDIRDFVEVLTYNKVTHFIFPHVWNDMCQTCLSFIVVFFTCYVHANEIANISPPL